MRTLNLDEVQEYVSKNIIDFHNRRIRSLEELNLAKLLTKNPYLFKAKNVITAGDIIAGLLDAFLSSSEEKLFGDFLEGLSIFIALNSCNGQKSAASGIDLEFLNKGIHYIISVKSGPNWGNSSQHKRQETDFKNAVTRIKQSKHGANVQPVLGICYGKTKTSYIRGYLKVVGQNFWYLISENKDMYTDIIIPMGYTAKEHNETFLIEKSNVANRFTKAFISHFCNSSGAIDWVRLVEFNSGNYDLDKYLR